MTVMTVLAACVGIALILFVWWEGFETIILPRRVTRGIRLTRAFYQFTWWVCGGVFGRIRNNRRRQSWLSYFGPLSLLLLLVVWVITLIGAFALLQWAAGSQLGAPPGDHVRFTTDLYLSGTTFFTVGLGDVAPRSALARVLNVIEGGSGFGFLALVISYLPMLYQAFSRRESDIALLDSRAGSPPSAVELLRRYTTAGHTDDLTALLRDWEMWSAELLESHLSYPVLCYFRSQHDDQNWLAALTSMLDVCALLLVGVDRTPQRQAQFTFAIARHAVVDLAQIFKAAPERTTDRLPDAEFRRVRDQLAEAGITVPDYQGMQRRLSELRGMYEPYVHALAGHLRFATPGWLPARRRDNWQTTAWGPCSQVSGPPGDEEREHF